MTKKTMKIVYSHLSFRANRSFDKRINEKILTLKSVDRNIAFLESEKIRLNAMIEYVVSQKPRTADTLLHYGKQVVGLGLMLFGNFRMQGISGHIVTHAGQHIGEVHHDNKSITPDNYAKILKEAETSYNMTAEKLQYAHQKREDISSGIKLLSSYSDATRLSRYIEFYGTIYIGSLILLIVIILSIFIL
jgi:hypothetical protein